LQALQQYVQQLLLNGLRTGLTIGAAVCGIVAMVLVYVHYVNYRYGDREARDWRPSHWQIVLAGVLLFIFIVILLNLPTLR
jgi:uncharacterized membrane-anchored protein